MELLSGWKEIAEHLHLGVRTAQRWERLGLPVRRVSDSSCSPVVAIPDELETWARTRDVKADVALIAKNQFLLARAAEMQQERTKGKRKARRLFTQIQDLRKQQLRILGMIRANLAPPEQFSDCRQPSPKAAR